MSSLLPGIKARVSKQYEHITYLKNQYTLSPSPTLLRNLFDAHASIGDVDALESTFNEIGIAIKEGKFPNHQSIYHRMMNFVVKFDMATSRPNRHDVDSSEDFLPERKDKYAVLMRNVVTSTCISIVSLNMLLSFYVNRKDLAAINRVIIEIRRKNLIPDIYTYNHLLRFHGHFNLDIVSSLQVYDSIPAHIVNYNTYATMLIVCAKLKLRFNYERFYQLLSQMRLTDEFEKHFISETLMNASKIMGDDEKSDEKLCQIILNTQMSPRLLETKFFSRIAFTSIEKVNGVKNHQEYKKIQELMSLMATPNLHTLEIEIRYAVACKDIPKAMQLVRSCASIMESLIPRRPIMSVLNTVFYACVKDDLQKEMEELLQISVNLGHHYENMARSMVRWYFYARKFNCVWQWKEKFSGCATIGVSNSILSLAMNEQGFVKGMEYFDHIITTLEPTTSTYNIILKHLIRTRTKMSAQSHFQLYASIIQDMQSRNIALSSVTVHALLYYYKKTSDFSGFWNLISRWLATVYGTPVELSHTPTSPQYPWEFSTELDLNRMSFVMRSAQCAIITYFGAEEEKYGDYLLLLLREAGQPAGYAANFGLMEYFAYKNYHIVEKNGALLTPRED